MNTRGGGTPSADNEGGFPPWESGQSRRDKAPELPDRLRGQGLRYLWGDVLPFPLLAGSLERRIQPGKSGT